jgi:hypothetical protein
VQLLLWIYGGRMVDPLRDPVYCDCVVQETVHQFAGQIMAKDLALSLFANESNGCWIW